MYIYLYILITKHQLIFLGSGQVRIRQDGRLPLTHTVDLVNSGVWGDYIQNRRTKCELTRKMNMSTEGSEQWESMGRNIRNSCDS